MKTSSSLGYYLILLLGFITGCYSLFLGLKWKSRLFIGIGVYVVVITLLIYLLGLYFKVW